MNESKQFVEGWDIIQTLGEGAYGEVKLLLNRSSGDLVAMKVIDLELHSTAGDAIRKEIAVHRLLNDPHVIKFIGHRKEKLVHYVFLEYADGGELFDRIEPDVGMPQSQAQNFFKQLIAGMEYLHSLGITHRDIKPENLLLNECDILKISDFGMATLFRYKGIERLLEKRCGTLPYVAPEVLLRSYHAEPADLWSCGIVLVTMLAGEYCHWKDYKLDQGPWIKIDNLALSLLRQLLMPVPSKRSSITQIKQHRWFLKIFKGELSNQKFYSIRQENMDNLIHSGCSQPDQLNDTDSAYSTVHPQFSFSQPIKCSDLLLSSQQQTTQMSQSQNFFQRLVKRMTRFMVKMSLQESQAELHKSCVELGYRCSNNTPQLFTISTYDKQKMKLVFKATLLQMENNVLLDFRLSRGDGIDFKRHFLKIRSKFKDYLLKGPITWPLAIATNSVP